MFNHSKAEDGVDDDVWLPSGLKPLGTLEPFPALKEEVIWGQAYESHLSKSRYYHVTVNLLIIHKSYMVYRSPLLFS
jgi:hypothetical protein